MKLTVNIDHGFAFNMDLIAGLLRSDENPSETRVVMVSGNTFIFNHPLSEVVTFIENVGQTLPPEIQSEVSGGSGA